MQDGPTPYILVIEDGDSRRLELLDELLRRGHRVVSCRSAHEAEEFTRHLTHGVTMPELVIIGERAEREGGRGLRSALEERFPQLNWITYKLGNDIDSLDEILGALIEEGRVSAPRPTFG
jgi:DNA-binding NtrC family response regulator